MKKKSFFSGFSAKLAFAAVALSSALLTGCYKDEGLDVIDPNQSITLPAAQYTVTGTVYDVNGAILKDAKVTATSGKVSVSNGSYTITELKAGSVDVTASCDKYESQTTTVNIAELKPGQAAVYPASFFLKEANTKEVPVKYNLKVTVLEGENMADITSEATIKVYGSGATEITDLAALEAGSYKIKASAEGYTSTIQYITLVKATEKIDATSTDEYVVKEYTAEIVLVKEATGTVVISGDLKFGDRWMLAKVVRLFNSKGTQFYGEGNSNTYAYMFNVPETEFVEEAANPDVTTRATTTVKSFLANFTIVDENGIELKMEQKIEKPAETSTPEDPGQGGEEEKANVEIKVDFSFSVEIAKETISTTPVATKDVFNPYITNAEETAKTYSYTAPMLKGTKFISASTVSDLLDTKTALGAAVAVAFEEAVKNVVVVEDYEKSKVENAATITLPAYTALKSVTSYQEFVEYALTPTAVYSTTSINGVAAEPVAVSVEGLANIKAVYEEAGVVTVSQDDIETESIDHGHGHSHSHGHGTGNAGGGIVEAE